MLSSSTLTLARGEKLGAAQFAPGSLHMFWTPFTKTEIKPRWAVRDLPAFKDFKLQGAEVAGEKTPWGWTAEFKLPWANFPEFKAKAGEIIGIDCELCSSDGGPRVDRTFVYSVTGKRVHAFGLRAGETRGEDRPGRIETVRSSTASHEPDEIGQLRLALRHRLHLAHHRQGRDEDRRQALGWQRQGAEDDGRQPKDAGGFGLRHVDGKLGTV